MEAPVARPTEDLTGKKFGKLRVLGKVPGPGTTQWACKCDCGNEKIVLNYNLKGGNTLSCGCLHKAKLTTHGMTGTRVHKAWRMMRQRCLNPKANGYQNYGGRGIGFDPSWDAFEQFFADMGHPGPKESLDRIDVNKGYSKENCRWASAKTQLNNKRDNRLITAFGKTQTLTQWAEEKGMKPRTLHNRIFRGEMNPEDALAAPMYAQQRGLLDKK